MGRITIIYNRWRTWRGNLMARDVVASDACSPPTPHTKFSTALKISMVAWTSA